MAGRMRRLGMLLVLCGWAWGGAQAQPQPLTRVTTGEIGGWLRLGASVAGVAGRWIVDTGSSHNLVSPAFAARLSLREGGVRAAEAGAGRIQGRAVELPPVRIGAIERGGQVALSADLGQVIGIGAQGIDGILGAPFLDGLDVDIDLARWRIEFHPDAGSACPAGFEAVPFSRVKGLPVLSLELPGPSQVRAVLDTGNPGGLLWFESRAAPMSAPGLRFEGARLVVAESMALGPLVRLHAPVVFFVSTGLQAALGPDVDALAGTALLDGARMRLSLAQRRLCLEPARTPVPGGFGLLLAERDGSLHVRAVLAGSPAEQAGLRAGEVVTGWAGAVMPTGLVDAWEQAAGRQELDVTVQGKAPVRLKRGYFAPRFGVP